MVSSDYPETDYLTRLTVKRLAELNRVRARVAALESRSGLLAEYELERKKLEILSRLQDQYGEMAPALTDASFAVAELKAYLQSVYDADVLGDDALRAITMQHCVTYATRTLDRMSEPGRYAMEGAAGVLELASSALCMFSQRAGAGEAFSEASSCPVTIKLLSPMYAPVVVVNIANTVGNMASDADFRIAFRSGGGVGALVRLLRADCESAVQAAAAAALSLLAARDLVIQDSCRYLGAIDLLVDLMGQGDAYTAETARYCLLSVRHGNTKNQAEIIAAIRANTALVRNVKRLDMASELLRFEEGTPRVRSSYAPLALSTASPARLRPGTASRTPDSYRRPLTSAGAPAASSYRSPRHDALLASASAAATARSVARSLEFANSLLRPASAAGAASISSTLSPRAAATTSTYGQFSPTGKYLAPPSSVLDTVMPADPAVSPGGGSESLTLGSLPQVDSELLRVKHLMRYSTEELATMLSEAGFDKLDLRALRLHGVSGLDLLDMSESEMTSRLLLPRHKVRKLRALQRAVALFDRIATLPRQGRLSEVELRLYLAGHGCSVAEVDKLVKLFRSLVRTDRLDFCSFWDFVSGYDWIAQAFKIYNVPA